MSRVSTTFRPSDSVAFSELLARVCGRRVGSYEITAQHPRNHHYGLETDKWVLDLVIKTTDGATLHRKLFAKGEAGADSLNHELVWQLGGPVPGFYGRMATADGKEWTLSEWIEINDVWFEQDEWRFLRDRVGFPALLQALARLNALTPPDTFRQEPDWEGGLADAPRLLVSIWELGVKGHIGPEIEQLCARAGKDLLAWQELAARILPVVRSMPTAFCHRDFCLYHCGRRATGEFALIDLSSCGYAPRFFDIARWLGPPDDLLPKSMTREELGRHYVKALKAAGGPDCCLDDLLKETETLWVAWDLLCLVHSKRFAQEGYEGRPEEYRDQDRREAQRLLCRQLATFMELERTIGK